MINFLKTYLVKDFFPNIREKDIEIIKTQNGLAHPHKKLVFYVFKGQSAQPDLVIYASRYPQANDILEQSIKNIELNHDFSPKILFKSHYQDILFVGLEYIAGQSLDLNNHSHLDLAFDYLVKKYNNNKNNPSKSLSQYYQAIKEKFLATGQEVDPNWEKRISQVSDIKLPTISQHGDFQDNNLFVVEGQLKIVDWDDYGFIDWPLFDWLTLYLKCVRKKVDTSYLQNKQEEFLRVTGLSKSNQDVLVLFYELFNFLRKDKLHNKYERAKYYSNLLKNLKK